MEWSNTQVLQLIDLYKEHECLWNPKHDRHKNKIAKMDAWNQISEQMGGDTVEIKKKIDSLLGSFRRERQKHESTYKTGSGTSDVYKSTWFAFKSMYFLMDKFKVNKTRNTEQLPEESNENEIRDATDNHPENTETDDNAIGSDHDSDQNEKNETVSMPKTDNRKSIFQSAKAKRTNYKQRTRSDEAYSILKKTVENRRARDESTIFGEHVATKHRKYSQHTKSVIEHLITNILFNADMGCYEKNTPNQKTSTLDIYSQSLHFGTSASQNYANQIRHFTPNTTPVPFPSPTLSSSEYRQPLSNQSPEVSSFLQNNNLLGNTASYPSSQNNPNQNRNFTPHTTPIPSPSPTLSTSEYSQPLSNKSSESSSFLQNNNLLGNTASYPSSQNNPNQNRNFTPHTTPIPSPSPTLSTSEYSQPLSNKSSETSSFLQNNNLLGNTASYPSGSTSQSRSFQSFNLPNELNTYGQQEHDAVPQHANDLNTGPTDMLQSSSPEYANTLVNYISTYSTDA